jgi:transcription termination/antitermination protein NusG
MSEELWYVLQVLSGHEKKVKANIEEFTASSGVKDYIKEVLVPSENVSEVKKGKQTISEKRLWPGYILIKMVLTDESWTYVKQSNGVIDFLGSGNPNALTQKEVDKVLDDLKSKKDGVTQKHNFRKGNQVKINEGVFINFVGTVLEVFNEKGRISVLVSIFGRETRVDDLEFWQVEKLTDEEEVEV